MDEFQAAVGRLEYLLTRATEFVRFSEAKNGILVALAGAIAFPLADLANKHSGINFVYLVALEITLFLAVVVALVSFIPVMKVNTSENFQGNNRTPNPYFFGHVASLTPNQLLEELGVDAVDDFKKTKLLEITDQVIANCRIAVRKLRFFNVSVWIILVGLLTPVGAGILLYFLKEKR